MEEKKQEEMVYIGVYPFKEGLEYSKIQGLKVLEEASEFYEAFIDYYKYILYVENTEDEIDEKESEIIQAGMARNFINEAADALQAIINLVYVVSGENIDNTQAGLILGMNTVNEKNVARGYYGEIKEESEEESEEKDEGESEDETGA